MNLRLSQDHIDKLLNAAARAYPNECCGLIEGTRDENSWRVYALHETKNLAENPRAHFLIDPETHFHLLRALRGTEREIIGCYHSHPDGVAVLSATDRASAAEEGFLWLIAATGKENSLRAFAFEKGDFREVKITG